MYDVSLSLLYQPLATLLKSDHWLDERDTEIRFYIVSYIQTIIKKNLIAETNLQNKKKTIFATSIVIVKEW